jgi:hypothetical protein
MSLATLLDKTSKFRFNDHGVCTNSENILVFDNKRVHATIHIAEYRGSWSYGTNHSVKGSCTGCGGGGSLPGIIGPNFASREKAITAALFFLEEYFMDRDVFKSDCKKMISAIRSYRAGMVKYDHVGPGKLPPPGRVVENDHVSSTPERGHYFGGAGGDGTFQALINQIPPHKTFISLFAGKCAVRYNMKPAEANYMFDLDETIIHFWRTWRKSKPEILHFDAQRKNAFDVLDEPWLTTATWLNSTFIFIDAPFPPSTRKAPTRERYKYEMTDAQHVQLAKILHKDYRDCKVMIRSYENPIYDKHLKGWHKVKYMNNTHGGPVQECAYLNYPPPEELHDYSFVGECAEERRRIKRKIIRHVNNLRKLPAKERNAIMHTLNQYKKHIFK